MKILRQNVGKKERNKRSQKLMRPAEVDTLLADYSRAKKNLKWKPKISFDDLVINMVEHDLENINKF